MDQVPAPPLRLLAAGTAVAVAAIYLTQPILNLLAPVLHASIREMGLVTTATQVGYAIGILFLVPLGDIFPKKRLIVGKLVLVALAVAATGLVTTAPAMVAVSLGIGLFATAAQDFVPLAAELSPHERRGAAIGTVMGGLLLGILGSRIFSGVLAQAAGWRAPFFATAGLAIAIAFLTWLRVPSSAPEHRSTYSELLRSMAGLVRREPLLVLSTIGQGFVGFTFSAFWTTLSFHLGGPPFRFSSSRIGAFALAGFAGAAIAPVAGRLADRHGPLFNIRGGIVLVALSFATMAAFPYSVPILIAAAVVFDLGVQLCMVSHQTVVFSLEPRARSRLNALFVGGLFGFFALGSFGATLAYANAGWRGVLGLCLASCGAAAAVHFLLSARWTQVGIAAASHSGKRLSG